jgi:hypothetical protein
MNNAIMIILNHSSFVCVKIYREDIFLDMEIESIYYIIKLSNLNKVLKYIIRHTLQLYY